MVSQTAFRFTQSTKTFEKISVEIPQITSTQVLLKVKAAGLCHSDLHIIDGLINLRQDQYILGHEVAGEIVEVGLDVKSVKVGERYAVNASNACAICENCISGKSNICIGNNSDLYGLGIDGGYQSYMAINNVRTLVKIPENVSYAQAAVTSDAILTPYHAIRQLNFYPGAKVLVIGAGGLGMNGVQLLRAISAYSVVVDLSAKLKDQALEFGANEFYTDLETSQHKEASFDARF